LTIFAETKAIMAVPLHWKIPPSYNELLSAN